MTVPYDRIILAMPDDELEKFCRRWAEKKQNYFDVERYAGANDKGRDVVGFCSKERHEGDWDNFQCKQYRSRVGTSEGMLALGKIFYWAWKKEFVLPRFFYFVAPRGISGPLRKLLDKPSQFGQELIGRWDKDCASKITGKTTIALESELRDLIETYQFDRVKVVTIDQIMADQAVVPLLVEEYGADPGQYPAPVVPGSVTAGELPYIRALVEAYGEREKAAFVDHVAVISHGTHATNLTLQRQRFFEADAFQKFYRDNTSPKTLEAFRSDVRLGIIETWEQPAPDMLDRVNSVMKQAGVIAPGGPLSKYAYISVKQGVCHHFVNDGELSWKVKV